MLNVFLQLSIADIRIISLNKLNHNFVETVNKYVPSW